MDMVLRDKTVCFYGQLAGMSRRSAAILVRQAGGRVTGELHEGVNLIVLGEGHVLEKDWVKLVTRSNEAARTAFERGEIRIITESELWQCFSVEAIEKVAGTGLSFRSEEEGETLYTPSMLAELVSLPVPVILHWHRCGLLQAKCQIARLPYFSAEEFLVAKQVKLLMGTGLTADFLSRRVNAFEERYPEACRVLLRLKLSADGRDVYFEREGILYDWRGQVQMGFIEVDERKPVSDRSGDDSVAGTEEGRESESGSENGFSSEGLLLDSESQREFELQMGRQVVSWCEEAWNSQQTGDLDRAVACYRSALMAGGADAAISFQLAEILEQQGFLEAASERYYMVLEMDEGYTDARIGLARVLAQLDRVQEALAAWEGVLVDQPNAVEAHFELGKLLYQLGRFEEAEDHLRYYQSMVPDSPRGPQIEVMLGRSREHKK